MTKQQYHTLKDLSNALKKSEGLAKAYEKNILGQELSEVECNLLFRLIAYLFYTGNGSSIKAAYSLALRYGIKSDDYEILFNLALSLRYYPVAKLLQRYDSKYSLQILKPADEILYRALASISSEQNGDYQLSDQQYWLSLAVDSQKNVAIVAPTSCGKSHLLVKKCLQQYCNAKTSCIIVPTKSLLTQTLHDLISAKGDRRNVITHPEMLTEKQASSPFIAILTQERLLSILTQHKNIKFDYIFVDEAHNLLPDDNSQRSRIMSRALIIAKMRNKNLKIDFYSPFLVAPEESLSSINNIIKPQISYSINEHMKIPQFIILEKQTDRLKYYDQFSNNFYNTKDKYVDYLDVILKRSGTKNIIYANKPADIEKVSSVLLLNTSAAQYSPESQKQIEDACALLRQLVDNTYMPIDLLEHGIVISHGKMPDLIKNYMEHLYKKIPEIRFIVTTSTLLEGVNVPAEKLFILSSRRGNANLSYADFHNLSGRIGRYNTIFSNSQPNPKLLMPEVYILHNTLFAAKSNFNTFLKTNANEAAKEQQRDNIENPLLKLSPKSNERNQEVSIIANIDNKNNFTSYKSLVPNIKEIKTNFGKQCCSYNIYTPYIQEYEVKIEEYLKSRATNNKIVSSGEELFECIKQILNNDMHNSNGWLRSLADQYKYDRYTKLINQKTNGDNYFTTIITSLILSWRSAIGQKIYVGSIGDESKNNSQQSQYRNYHTFTQSDSNLIPSYAVALTKEYFDNIEQYILPYVEILHYFNCIEDNFYKKLKYGTDDDLTIALTRLGLDFSIARAISKNNQLRDLFAYNANTNEITYNKDVVIATMHKVDIAPFYISIATKTL